MFFVKLIDYSDYKFHKLETLESEINKINICMSLVGDDVISVRFEMSSASAQYPTEEMIKELGER